MSKQYNYFYCVQSFATKNKLESLEKVGRNKDFWGIALPTQRNNILEFNQCMESAEIPY